jgi:glutaminyl-peptide cyclotransferase
MRRFATTMLAILALSWLAACVGSASRAENDAPQVKPNVSTLKVLSTDFSGSRAYGFLKKQVAMGPRVPGTNAHALCRSFIKSELEPYCTGITEQTFDRVVNGRDYTFNNVIAYIHPDAPKLVMLVAHFDTRPFADKDTPANYSTPIPGANDGASGVAALLELAKMLSASMPDNVGVLFLFTDGEDTGNTAAQMFAGADYFASKMDNALMQRIAFGVLLDMIGDVNLNILPESHSEASAPKVYLALLELQEMLGLSGFSTFGQNEIWDDHLAFIDRGVKMYDLIDFDYAPWHTLQDTPDKCSGESLRVVGLCVGNLVLNYAQGKFRP